MPTTRLIAATIAAFALIPATAHADVAVTARPTGTGYTHVTVVNRTKEPHGVMLLKPKRQISVPRLLKVLETNDESRIRPLVAALGGIQQVDPGKRWEMTERLTAGNYLALDYGAGPQPRVVRFSVARSKPGKAPAADGTITMTDDSLTTAFSGRGVAAIANRGTGWHELSLVKTPAGATGKDVLDIVHSQQAPPPGFEVHEGLWVLDPGRTAYVNFDLPQGHYVALCLIEGHAERGMISEFDVS